MSKKHIAHNIKWDTDGDMKLFKTLPQEIEIPDEVWEDYDNGNDDALSDYVSDVTGFCHYGFEVRIKKIKEEDIMNKITIYDHIKLGDTFHNDNGEDYLILSIDTSNDYTLLFRAKNKYTPFVWAYGIREGSWTQGHYFKDIHEAMDYYNNMNKPETFTVHVYDEDELIDMTTFSNCADAVLYALETAAHEVVNDKTGEVVYTK